MEENSTTEQILRGALGALSRQGPRRLSITDVAERAGVARGTVYRYFEDRDTLMRAVGDYVQRTFRNGLDDAISAEPAADARLDVVLRYTLEFPRSVFGALELREVDASWLLGRLRGERAAILQAIEDSLEPLASSVAEGPSRASLALVSRIILQVGFAQYLVPGPDDEDVCADVAAVWDGLLAADRSV